MNRKNECHFDIALRSRLALIIMIERGELYVSLDHLPASVDLIGAECRGRGHLAVAKAMAYSTCPAVELRL
jgi:hypothetical protein